MGILSHELRTPVTTILAGSKVLARRQHLPGSTRAELIEDIEAEAERLYRLVEDLLVLARFGRTAAGRLCRGATLAPANPPSLLTRRKAAGRPRLLP